MAGDNRFMFGGLWAPAFTRNPSLKVIGYLDSSLRVETLSFQEAAGFIPQSQGFTHRC
jgi:hypothetical protein